MPESFDRFPTPEERINTGISNWKKNVDFNEAMRQIGEVGRMEVLTRYAESNPTNFSHNLMGVFNKIENMISKGASEMDLKAEIDALYYQLENAIGPDKLKELEEGK